MSFALLKARVIDTGECIKCGACARNCKHIVMNITDDDPKGSPVLKGKCIMTTNRGLKCGNCYNGCPIVLKHKKNGDENFLTLREKVLKLIKEQSPMTIPKMSEVLGESTMKVRFEALRLVQLGDVSMKIEPGNEDPLFLVN